MLSEDGIEDYDGDNNDEDNDNDDDYDDDDDDDDGGGGGWEGVSLKGAAWGRLNQSTFPWSAEYHTKTSPLTISDHKWSSSQSSYSKLSSQKSTEVS